MNCNSSNGNASVIVCKQDGRDDRPHDSQDESVSPAQKHRNLSSPRSVASTKASASKNIFTERSAPPAPYPGDTRERAKSATSFLPPLMSMLSLSFDSEDDCDEHDSYSTEHTGDSYGGMPLLRSILKSPLYTACTSGTAATAGCKPSSASTLRKSVSFSRNLNNVETISAIDHRIKSKQRSQSMSNLPTQHDPKRNNATRGNALGHFTSSLTCVSNLTCNSFRYYSTAVDDSAVPMMSVFNIDDNEEDW